MKEAIVIVGCARMIQTIKPDDRGRVSLLPDLKLIGWKTGDAVEIDLIKVVEVVTTD